MPPTDQSPVEVHECSFKNPIAFRNFIDVKKFKEDNNIFKKATAYLDSAWLVIKIPDGAMGDGFLRTVRVPFHNIGAVILKSDLPSSKQAALLVKGQFK